MESFKIQYQIERNECAKLPVADALFLAASLSFFVVIFHFQNKKLNKIWQTPQKVLNKI